MGPGETRPTEENLTPCFEELGCFSEGAGGWRGGGASKGFEGAIEVVRVLFSQDDWLGQFWVDDMDGTQKESPSRKLLQQQSGQSMNGAEPHRARVKGSERRGRIPSTFEMVVIRHGKGRRMESSFRIWPRRLDNVAVTETKMGQGTRRGASERS